MTRTLPYWTNKNWDTPGAVKAMQEHTGLSNLEFAEKCGISEATLKRLIHEPSQYTRTKLNRVADEEIAKMLGGSNG